MRHTLMHGSAALVLALAGCGGQAETASSADGEQRRIDACGLATPAEVAALAGVASVDTSGGFSEHTYTRPTSYTASCSYMGPGAMVMVAIHYPIAGPVPSAAELASRVTEHIRSQEESDSVLAEVYRTLQVRPLTDLSAPAAEYEIAGTTTLEARVGDRSVRVIAGSSDSARRVARTLIERLG